MAVEKDAAISFRTLVQEKAKVNLARKSDGNTALHIAMDRDISYCRVLIQAGAYPYTKNHAGETPLSLTQDVEFQRVLTLMGT